MSPGRREVLSKYPLNVGPELKEFSDWTQDSNNKFKFNSSFPVQNGDISKNCIPFLAIPGDIPPS